MQISVEMSLQALVDHAMEWTTRVQHDFVEKYLIGYESLSYDFKLINFLDRAFRPI